MLEDDVTRSEPEEALLEVGIGIVHVLREDLALIGNPYFSETTVKFQTLGEPSLKYWQSTKRSSLTLGCLFTLAT